tara:strand:- start:7730 stop:8728 length:999 start_codon:yes stop_codon:yes gene_type:complete
MADELLTTDEEILNSIGEGDTNAESVEQQSTETTETNTTATPQENLQSGGEISGSGETGDVSPDQSNIPEQSRGPQDLVDVNGNVVARGGKERRFYETAQKERQRAENLQKETQELRTKVEAYEGTNNLTNQYSLSPEELTQGAQLIAAFKENPVETVKYMLTQAQSAGHNIDGVGNGTDVAAIQKIVNEAVAPLTADRQQQLETEKVREEATQVYTDFMAKYPDAAVHQNTLAQLIESDSSLTPDAAYFKLKAFYADKGLDWNVTLAEHDKRLQSQQQQQQQEPSTQSTLPTGGTPADNVTNTAEIASVETDMEDIIKESMNEAGYTTNAI